MCFCTVSAIPAFSRIVVLETCAFSLLGRRAGTKSGSFQHGRTWRQVVVRTAGK